MQEKKSLYSLFVCISFFLVLVGFGVAGILLPDKTVSASERRYYEQLPALSLENVLDGSYMENMESYLLDQFAGREVFRVAKTEIETGLLGKTDANGYVKVDNYLFELDYDWSKKQVTKTAQAFAALQRDWFVDANVYYAVIPDKASFLPEEAYLVGDDGWVLGQMNEYLTDAVYLDLYPYLTLDDYYKTDLHWRQEAIVDVADVLLGGMQAPDESTGQDLAGQVQDESGIEDLAGKAAGTSIGEVSGSYETTLITSEFYGGYAGASAFATEPDALYSLSSAVLEQATVYDYETGKETTIYAAEKIEGTDPYDYYLWGARALLTVKNPFCENGKKLLLFRDSFGSSIAPLLLEGYEEITLVDLRYVTAAYLPNLLDLESYEDVLFLYSENVLRNSGSLKF